MKTNIIKYKVEIVSDIFRIITVYDYNDILIAELECVGNFYTDWEEIRRWLDDNGYGDDDYEFVNVTEPNEKIRRI